MSDSSSSNKVPRTGIDQISTRWAFIRDPVKFVMRYAPAIQGYLGVFLKNPHDVEDVCQALLLRVVERGMVEENLLQGRFRDYLIATVRNAALAHLRRRSLKTQDGCQLEGVAAVPEVFVLPDEEEWLSRWRRVVLSGAWDALEMHENEHPGNLSFTALRALVEHPDESSSQLAARVSQVCGRIVAPEAFRKQVSRARRLFAEFLVAETARTLDNPTPQHVEEELIDIGVMKHVQPFLPPDWQTSGKLLDGE
jgi:RNA polymerase sigma-70 factor (ECF subfamily)